MVNTMNNYEIFLTSFSETTCIIILLDIFNQHVKYKIIKYFASILFLSIIVTLTNSLSSWIAAILNFTFLFFILFLLFRKKIQELILEVSLILVFIIIAEMLLDNVVMIFTTLINLNNEFILQFLSNILLIIMCIYINLRTPNNILKLYSKQIKKLTLLLVIMLFYIFIIKMIWEYNKNFVLNNEFIFIMFPIIMCFLNFIFIFWYDKVISYKKSLEMYNRYNPAISGLIDEIRQRQHDFKNHLTTIYGMIIIYEERDLKINLKKYLESLQNSFSEIDEYIQLENRLLTAITYMKFGEAKRNNIHFQYSIDSGAIKFPLKDYELSEVLNNLIDNAFDAVHDMEPHQRNVYLKITESESEKSISISNTKPVLIEKNISNIFKKGFSTKMATGHGFGLYTVKKLVQKYNGKIEISLENEHFTIRIIFN